MISNPMLPTRQPTSQTQNRGNAEGGPVGRGLAATGILLLHVGHACSPGTPACERRSEHGSRMLPLLPLIPSRAKVRELPAPSPNRGSRMLPLLRRFAARNRSYRANQRGSACYLLRSGRPRTIAL